MHGAPFTDDEVEMIDGVAVTSIPRTMVDLARTLESSRAAVPGDEVVRRGWTTDDLMVAARRATRWPGVRRARRLIPLLDGRSESAGESRSRVLIARLGFPTPQLQHELFDSYGRLVARGDFAWPELQLLGEYDGRMKYGVDNPSDQRPEDVVWSEKIREDAVRDLDWNVVRWTTHHLDHPAELAALLDRAFRRAQPRGGAEVARPVPLPRPPHLARVRRTSHGK